MHARYLFVEQIAWYRSGFRLLFLVDQWAPRNMSNLGKYRRQEGNWHNNEKLWKATEQHTYGWLSTDPSTENSAMVLPDAIEKSNGDTSSTLMSEHAPGNAKKQCQIKRSLSHAHSYTTVGLSLLPFLNSPCREVGHLAHTQWLQSKEPRRPGQPNASCFLHISAAKWWSWGGRYFFSNA